jgi:hypothetical protein
LNPSEDIHRFHLLSKLLRPKDREKEVSNQYQPDEDPKDVVHCSKPLATAGIKNAQPEKNA